MPHNLILLDDSVGHYFDVILSAYNDGPCVMGINKPCISFIIIELTHYVVTNVLLIIYLS